MTPPAASQGRPSDVRTPLPRHVALSTLFFAAQLAVGMSAAWSSPLVVMSGLSASTASAYWPTSARTNARGIAAIAPVQPIPVAPAAPLAMREESLVADQCTLLEDEGGVSASTLDMSDPWDRLLAEACAKQEAGWIVTADDHVPAVGVDNLGLRTTPRPAHARLGEPLYRPATMPASLAPLPSLDATVYGTRNVVRRTASGPSIAFGSVLTRAPSWSDAARIGGVQFYDGKESATGILPTGEYAYSSGLGVLDYTDLQATSGGYQYGATAGAGSLRYGLTDAMTLESHVEAAPSLTAVGLGSSYSIGDMGVVRAGATQSAFGATVGQRTRLGYSVNLADAVTLGYTNEHIGMGYNDLADYASGPAAENQVRNTFAAGMPLGWAGTLSGTYSGLRGSNGLVERRVGLAHRVSLSPTVALGLNADRDTVSGNYAMRMTLAMPVDSFLGRLGLW